MSTLSYDETQADGTVVRRSQHVMEYVDSHCVTEADTASTLAFVVMTLLDAGIMDVEQVVCSVGRLEDDTNPEYD